MKILHVITSLGIGGAEIVLKDLVTCFSRSGVDVTVIVLLRVDSFIPEILLKNGVTIVCCPVNKKVSLRNMVFLTKHLLRNKYDIVHAHLSWEFYMLAVINIIMGKKMRLVASEHSTITARRSNFLVRFFALEKLIYRQYKKIICVSKDVRCSLVKFLPQVSDKCIVITNGIDLKKFSSVYRVRSEFQIILCIGSLYYQKGQSTLIKAIKYIPDAQLWLVGDGPDRDELIELTKMLGLQARVFFLGECNNVLELFGRVAVYVQPSLYEGFGIAALEAMAAGLPVIVSNVSGWNGAVKSAGIFFPVGDEVALADAINKVLQQPELFNFLSAESKLAAKNYDIEKTAANYLRLYENLLLSVKN